MTLIPCPPPPQIFASLFIVSLLSTLRSIPRFLCSCPSLLHLLTWLLHYTQLPLQIHTHSSFITAPKKFKNAGVSRKRANVLAKTQQTLACKSLPAIGANPLQASKPLFSSLTWYKPIQNFSSLTATRMMNPVTPVERIKPPQPHHSTIS